MVRSTWTELRKISKSSHKMRILRRCAATKAQVIRILIKCDYVLVSANKMRILNLLVRAGLRRPVLRRNRGWVQSIGDNCVS